MGSGNWYKVRTVSDGKRKEQPINMSNDGLDEMEQRADKCQNISLLFQIQILREIRELKELLEAKKKGKEEDGLL